VRIFVGLHKTDAIGIIVTIRMWTKNNAAIARSTVLRCELGVSDD